MEKSIAQETQDPQDQEELDDENPGQDPAQDKTESLPSTSGSILTGGNLPMVELGLVPFTPSKKHQVAKLEDVFFYPKRKAIVWRTERTLKIDTQPEITTVTQRMVVKDVEEDLIQMASLRVATTHANYHNISKLMETLYRYKGKMEEMKELLRKEERVG